MGEVAEMFDVNASLIRYWESKFDILKPYKNKKGNRMFTPADVDHLKLIHHLVKEKGMTLAGAKKRLKENPEGSSRDMEIIDRLLSIKAILMELRQELGADDGEIYRETDHRYDEDPAAAYTASTSRSAVPPATASSEIRTEKKQMNEESTASDQFSGRISDLSGEAGISKEEGDEPIENENELSLVEEPDIISDDGFASDPVFAADITDEDLILPGSDEDDHMIHGSSYPNGIDNARGPSLFSINDITSAADTTPPAKEESRPQIIEQTLF